MIAFFYGPGRRKAPVRLRTGAYGLSRSNSTLGGLAEATLNYRSAQRRDCGTGATVAICGALVDCGTSPVRLLSSMSGSRQSLILKPHARSRVGRNIDRSGRRGRCRAGGHPWSADRRSHSRQAPRSTDAATLQRHTRATTENRRPQLLGRQTTTIKGCDGRRACGRGI
jgi:hypothetical protein